MVCNYCGKPKVYKVGILHYVGHLCTKCKDAMIAELEDVAWKYLKTRREQDVQETKE